MPDVVVQHGDQQITVPIEAVTLPDGFAVLSQDDLTERFYDKETVKKDFVPKSEFTRRLASKIDKEKAHEDETVVARVLELHQKASPNVDEIKAQWEKANLAPLREKYSALREGLKAAQIREAAKEFFDDVFVDPLPGGAPSMAEVALGRQFDLDDSTAALFAIGDDGKPLLAANPDGHNQNRSAHEHLELLAKDPRYARYLKPERRNVGGSGKPGQDGAVGGKLTSKSQIPSEEKAAWIKKNGYAAYAQLAE